MGGGFSEWAAETPLAEDEYRTIRELDLIESFDFHWDEAAGEVAYDAPEIPQNWEAIERFSIVDSWSTVSAINEELDALGETVAGVLTDYYVDWETEEHVVETFGEQFNARDDVLTEAQDEREE